MKLAIVYHVYKNSSSLKASLENIFNQTDQNFELILINDAASSTVTKILKEFNFSKLQKFTYFKYSQNLGHAVSFNQAITHTDSDYVIFVGSNFVPNKNFVKLVNNTLKKSPNTDVISFNAVKNDNSCQIFDKINNKMKLMLDKSMKDKIFSVNLLRKQKILLNEQSYAPLTFIYQVLISFRK
jgi:glycosyltransferase involved in cell wall biosynthesis